MNKVYIPTIISLTIFGTLHHVGSYFRLYISIPGYDVVMHILGGVCIALASYWIIMNFFEKPERLFTFVILITIVGGLSWEVMEAYFDIAGGPVGSTKYYIDTIKDLFNDTLGAVIACLFLRK